MSIITNYPLIPNVANEDLLIISDVSEVGNPTRTVSIGLLSDTLSPPTGINLSTIGTSGASTIVGNILNIPIYQGSITLTTDGTTGPSTLVGDTLNIPDYASSGLVATSLITGTVKLNSDVVQATVANSITETALRTYGIQFNSNEQMVVNVPWTDTTYSLTTNGSSGPSTLSAGHILNVPNYIPYERIFMELNINDITLNPEIQVHYNTTAVTFTVATNAAGLYVITASSGIFWAFTRTHFSIMNPNVLAPLAGTGIMPMPTIARVKSETTFGVDCYRADSGADIGVATNLPTNGFSVTIEARIYNVPM